MKSFFTVKNTIYLLLIIFVGIQFIRIDLENPQVDRSIELTEMANPPAEVQRILKAACYDCHSHETQYPWYSHVAPFSWIIGDHIYVGREELNFSVWGDYSVKRQDHKLKEMIEQVEDGEMPLVGYVKLHTEADLSEEQKAILLNWIENYRGTLEVPNE